MNTQRSLSFRPEWCLLPGVTWYIIGRWAGWLRSLPWSRKPEESDPWHRCNQLWYALKPSSKYQVRTYCSSCRFLSLEEPQSRFGDKPLKFQVIYSQMSPKRNCSPKRVFHPTHSSLKSAGDYRASSQYRAAAIRSVRPVFLREKTPRWIYHEMCKKSMPWDEIEIFRQKLNLGKL